MCAAGAWWLSGAAACRFLLSLRPAYFLGSALPLCRGRAACYEVGGEEWGVGSVVSTEYGVGRGVKQFV
jgi:hypothetical protein